MATKILRKLYSLCVLLQCISCVVVAVVNFPPIADDPPPSSDGRTNNATHNYTTSSLKSYIVSAPSGRMPSYFSAARSWHAAAVTNVIPAGDNPDHRLVYSFKGRAFQGFVAKLTDGEAAKMKQEQGLIPVEDKLNQIHTTRTPQFLGLYTSGGNIFTSDNPLWAASKRGQDVIVGLLDTGVWPERKSFNDAGYSPVPSRWKGTCESYSTFNGPKLCNRKLIGARIFYRGFEAALGTSIDETLEFKSPRDKVGHGTHTASTAAGNIVANASLMGSAAGYASGVAPRARIAMYKVCWGYVGCYDSDILAGFEAAIADGVDIISVSLGGGALDYTSDGIALGAFSASVNGILTVASAGNSGPYSGSVVNIAPWMLTVAASTIDRRFSAPVTLGNGLHFEGESLYCGKSLGNKPVPMAYAGDPALLAPGIDYSYAWLAPYCANASVFNPDAVKGKVLVCESWIVNDVVKGLVVQKTGGVGMIVVNQQYEGETVYPVLHVLPATTVGYSAGEAIKSYIANFTVNATVVMKQQTTLLGVKPAPAVASFSSRGPNPVTPEILKPDVTAPGVNILAAFTGAASPTGAEEDTRRTDFAIMSGTSMSCPHVSGLAALIKAAHPTWSPAAIRSAIITTAYILDNNGRTMTDAATGRTAFPTSYGAGHVNPNASLNPGLVYDVAPTDYMNFLCSLNYTSQQMAYFTSTTFYYNGYNCSGSKISNPGDINYPSFSVVFRYTAGDDAVYSATFTRTVTNVGPATATYTASVKAPPYVSVSVSPSTLVFKPNVKKLSYKVTFKAQPLGLVPDWSLRASTFGSLTWTSAAAGGATVYKVTSPVAFSWWVAA